MAWVIALSQAEMFTDRAPRPPLAALKLCAPLMEMHKKEKDKKKRGETVKLLRGIFRRFSSFGVRCAMTRLVYTWNWEKGLSDHPIKVVPLQRPSALPLLSLLGSTH